MNRHLQIGLGGVVVVAMFLLVWLFSGRPEEKPNQMKRSTFVSSDWSVRYRVDDKKPLGCIYLRL